VIVLYGLAIFVSAGLVFLVQPMTAKLLLPTFGGSPQVWTASMVFFQAALLAGYGYADLSTRRLGLRRQPILHAFLLFLPLLVLPIGLRGLDQAGHLPPAIAVVAILLVSVGAPYVAVAATSPLLQRWFSATGHQASADPYFLYAAGNVGSLIGLLGYPLLVEPNLPISAQAALWSIGYALFVGLCVACAVVIARREAASVQESGVLTGPPPSLMPVSAVAFVPAPASLAPAAVGEAPIGALSMATAIGSLAFPAVTPAPPPAAAALATTDRTRPIDGRRRLGWVFRAFIPSSLMLGVTTYSSTDIAAVPLLWVIPLALYLLTFVFAFARRRPPTRVWERLLPVTTVVVVLTIIGILALPIWARLGVHYAGFFVAAMVAHGQLADDRPGSDGLTQFYLVLSVGGVLGGVFNALVAPAIFDSVIEYPLVIVLALLLRRGGGGLGSIGVGAPTSSTSEARAEQRARLLDIAIPFFVYLAVLVGLVIVNRLVPDSGGIGRIVVAASVVLTLVFVRRPVRFALAVAALLAITFLGGQSPIFADRTFFGVNRVIDDGTGHRIYLSGATVHGVERTDAVGGRTALSYYHPTGPAGQIFGSLPADPARPTEVAVIGLGAGGLAAYGRPGQHDTFVEIDPVVIRIASDPSLFRFVTESGASVDIVEADGRLWLQSVPDQSLDLIVLDAFSSDAIPAHLLTREAVSMYVAKLRPGGRLLFNVTNTYLDVQSVVAGAARALSLTGYWRHDGDLSVAPPGDKEVSEWVVLAPDPSSVTDLAADSRWVAISAAPRTVTWTDDFSDILGVIK